MKYRFFILTAFLFIIGWLYMGCSDTENNSAPEEPSIEMEGEVDVRPVVGSDGGTSTVTFTASGDWTASVSAVTRTLDWLSVSPTQGGAGTVTLQISAQPNESYDERNAAVLLTCGNAQQTITVTQKQKDALLVNSHKVEMDAEGGTFDIELQANVNVTYEIEEAAKDWLTASSSSSTRGLTTFTLNFQVAENPEESVRQAVITLQGNDLREEVTVYQAGSEPAILLSQKEYTVPSDGETIRVELKSNTSYKVVMPDVSWITEASTRAFSAYTHYFTVAVNESYDARTAEITFINKENNIEEKVYIIQVQKDAILVAQNEYIVGPEGDRLDFAVNANVDFTVETSVDWIQQTATRGLVEKPLSFTITENTTDKSREGEIIISYGELKQTIKIVQRSIIEKEREALIAFYQAAGGDKWVRKDNWCSDKPVNEWYGINVNSTGHVDYITLQSNALNGDIEDMIHALSPLNELRVLDWLGNDSEIYGSFPEDFYGFKHLEILYIPSNLQGQLDERIIKLNQLKGISLSGVNISYSVLQDVCNALTDLETLSLSYCNLENKIPAEIGNLKSLSTLNLSFSNIKGTIPDEIWTLPLTSLNLQCNSELTGSISPNIQNLKNITSISLDFCSLNGEIPEEICQCNSLEYLWLQDNQLEGNIPANIGNMEKLFYLELQNNNLTGTLPASMSKLSNLLVCNLYGNRLSGAVPEEVSNMWDKWNPLNMIIPQQDGYTLTYQPLYASTDYSKDGEVQLLQKHTEGQGIPVILMGDAFVDKDMESGGYYDATMERAMEVFFSIEPMISLRPLFDVYSIRCVSENNYIGGNTALSSWHYCGSAGDGDLSKCLEYASLVVDNLKDVSIHVIMNDKQQIGFCTYLDDNCTVSFNTLHDAGGEWQNFEAVFRHEGIGHGFGLLGDEYAQYIETISEEDKQNLRYEQQMLGRYLNLDITNDSTKILWSKFLADKRYDDEDLGIYEGGWASYSNGIYRPSYVSIMRYNEPAFNAPSREAIYKRAMKLAYGDSWTYDYETFVEFDLKNKSQTIPGATSRTIQSLDNHRAPRIVPYTTNEILQKSK
ncbi:BACON domain-containing carbohydrate-binding protein [Mediterranea massiliensis]|uniref:BACON domain-containing protein n=1 Tax=Mediterranea massiliensis TaxID=1841865 RepID=UPI0023F35994|nr:BACON domain-containing carbohydrate-binding protein [Mediterranea massiliensis]